MRILKGGGWNAACVPSAAHNWSPPPVHTLPTNPLPREHVRWPGSHRRGAEGTLMGARSVSGAPGIHRGCRRAGAHPVLGSLDALTECCSGYLRVGGGAGEKV